MNEQLISFETAKLAKEKGFEEECIFRFQPREFNKRGEIPMRSAIGDVKFNWNDFSYTDYV